MHEEAAASDAGVRKESMGTELLLLPPPIVVCVAAAATVVSVVVGSVVVGVDNAATVATVLLPCSASSSPIKKTSRNQFKCNII